MTTPPPAPSKSPLDQRVAEDAKQPPTQQLAGAPKVVAEGVPSSVRPDPHADDGRRPVAWLHIVAPPSYSASPSARSWCSCGRDIFAAGRARALALIADHEQHRIVCPLLDQRREAA
ncbi:hypothetical protein OG594_02795 [Streptomyces sp. NBC_01214]|uniref:hypothetical protein n=1 Tax=Streptomyces sp. NBC_01214 TaxID=2903777 RepID=UPI0022591903|nr:hypothetical protein [Streptomyces sp. NBC_01214]MCX4800610.1 hypothetical protein [Streptomyces sp. NBC_01214]